MKKIRDNMRGKIGEDPTPQNFATQALQLTAYSLKALKRQVLE
jgi:hypothetical protein